MHLDSLKEEIIEAIKHYRITSIGQLEYKTNLSWHNVKELLRNDTEFRNNVVDHYIEKNNLERRARNEEALERIAKARENSKGYELER